ncbi:MAG: hypothetical protein JWO86_2812 [Myxococcaceae bacterium]|nr:hypothetical protein [Myxococcaceae bacterium]
MKYVSMSPKARKHLYLYAFTVVVASGAALAGACSSSDSGSSGTVADSGADGSKSSSGASGTSGTDTGTVGAQDKDTCKGAATGNSCQCSCAITGQTEDKTLHCLQPAQDTGECPKLCCTGELDSGGSSSGTIIDAGDEG